MRLKSDMVLCENSYATTVMGNYYFLPRTVIKADGYVYDWINKNLLLELYLNAFSNIRDYSVYNRDQEEVLLQVFFPALDADEAFARFRSLCLTSFSTINRCYQILISDEMVSENGLWCGMPYHIFRLYMGTYYDALSSASDRELFKSIWFPEHAADMIYYHMLSMFVHIAMNSPGETVIGVDIGDYEEFLGGSSGNLGYSEVIEDVGQRYLQKASEFIATTFKGKGSNQWVSMGDSVMLCPLTRNIMNVILQCREGLGLLENPIMQALGLDNITVQLDDFSCFIYTEHDGVKHELSGHVIGAVHLSSMLHKTTINGEYRVGMRGVGYEETDRIHLYDTIGYNQLLTELKSSKELESVDLSRFEVLDFLQTGYYVRLHAVVFVFRNGLKKHPVPIGFILKDLESEGEEGYVFLPAIGEHLEDLSKYDVYLEKSLPYNYYNGIPIVNFKETDGIKRLISIQLNIDVSKKPLSFNSIQQAFKLKQGLFQWTRVPERIIAIESIILSAYHNIGYYQ